MSARQAAPGPASLALVSWRKRILRHRLPGCRTGSHIWTHAGSCQPHNGNKDRTSNLAGLSDVIVVDKTHQLKDQSGLPRQWRRANLTSPKKAMWQNPANPPRLIPSAEESSWPSTTVTRSGSGGAWVTLRQYTVQSFRSGQVVIWISS